jgi:hypothetical protein
MAIYAGERAHKAIVAGTSSFLVVAAGSRGTGRIFTRPITSHAPAGAAHLPAIIPTAEVPSTAAAKIPSAAVAVVLSPQRCEPLLLGVCVDVCADYETDYVEEGHPRVLGQELLGEGQRDWRNNPAHLHDWHEASLDGSPHLVEGACAGNHGHGHEVYRVLNGRDLQPRVSQPATLSWGTCLQSDC